MNTSLQTLKRDINKVAQDIKDCTNRSEQMKLKIKQRELLNALHLKKFKTRQQTVERKIKKAESAIPKKPEQPVKIVYRDVPIEVIKEVPIEVPVEVTVEKEVFVNAGGGIPTELETDEFIALLNDVRQVYIRTHTDIRVGMFVKTSDGIGLVKLLHVDEAELSSKKGGIFAKLKRVRQSDGKEGQRYMGADKRGYKVCDLEVIKDVKKELNIK